MDIYSRAKDKLNITQFNRMQEEAFEIIPKGNDTVLLSLTGSGKTLAFLLPLFEKIDLHIKRTQLLIITPTRELALQIKSVIDNLAMGFNSICCYGGHPVRFEKKALESNPEIVVGTPGRILDHIEREHLDPLIVKYLVLDEFDKTLEMGFHKQMESIIVKFRYKPQYILTSATDAIEIPQFVPLHECITLNHIGDKKIEGLNISKVISPSKDKLETLYNLLCEVGHKSTFVFCNYRESVVRISEFLQSKGIKNDVFHGGLDQIDRENVMSKFRNGSTRILITTDLAGRGLDIPHVENVVHYHLPISEEIFIHRNGRTARMEASGESFVIISTTDKSLPFINEIEKEHKMTSPETTLPETAWITVMINKGKVDKIRKGDVVGFLFKVGQLENDDLGIVEVKDKYALAAIRSRKVNKLISKIDRQKIKGKKALVRRL